MSDSLQIIGSRQGGGAERFFVRLVTALNRRGHRAVAVVPPDSWVEGALPADIPRERCAMRSVWDPLARWRLQQLVRRHRPPIVQTWMGRATRLLRLPAGGSSVHVARLGGYYNLKGYRHAHAWIGNTRGIRDYLIEEGLPERAVFHVGNFVDAAPPIDTRTRCAFRATHGIPEQAWLLFALGRLHPNKGFSDLLAAFERLPESLHGQPLHLMIAGEGPLRETLHRQAAEGHAASRIHWPGWLDDPNTALQSADLFVCPSRHEPLGNVILEAWASGAPVLSTATAGGRELIDPGVDGVLVPVGDVAALARGIEELMRWPAERLAELAAAGRARVEHEFSESAITGRYLDLYRHLGESAHRN